MRRVIIIVLVLFVAVAYMATYTVRFTENAVVTTFGKAGDNAVKTEPGLKLTIPYVQQVAKYDSRVRYLESRPETQQTADSRQIVVTSFVTWKVNNPKLFFQTFSGAGERAANHYRKAEDTVGQQLRSAMQELSKFRFDQLLSAQPGGSSLEDAESRILIRLKTDENGKDSSLLAAGIQPVSVGIINIELPEETTKEVFKAMQQNRARIAEATASQGRAMAETIRKRAEIDAARIMTFAERRAQMIRSRGDVEAQKYLRQLGEEPELAIFLKNMDFWRDSFADRTTLVIPTGGPAAWPGFELFGPDSMKTLGGGRVPRIKPPEAPHAGAPDAADEKSPEKKADGDKATADQHGAKDGGKP